MSDNPRSTKKPFRLAPVGDGVDVEFGTFSNESFWIRFYEADVDIEALKEAIRNPEGRQADQRSSKNESHVLRWTVVQGRDGNTHRIRVVVIVVRENSKEEPGELYVVSAHLEG